MTRLSPTRARGRRHAYLRAAAEVARGLGGDPSELTRFSEGSSSGVWGLPDPAVVLIVAGPHTSRPDLEQRVAAGRWLADLLPFVRPTDGVVQPLSTEAGPLVTVWDRVPTSTGAPPWDAVGQATAALHRVDLARAPAAVSLTDADSLDDVRAAVPRLVQSRRISATSGDVLHRLTDRLDSELAGLRGRRSVVHGDLHRHNVLTLVGGGAMLCDTDELACADPWWDLGFLIDPGRPTLRSPADRAAFASGYGSDLPPEPAARTVARAAHLRRTVRLLARPRTVRGTYWERVRLDAWREMLDHWERDLQPAVAQPRREQIKRWLRGPDARRSTTFHGSRS